MTSKEVCEYLQISIMTLRRRIAAGTIKPLPTSAALQRPAKLLFDRAEIEKLLKS